MGTQTRRDREREQRRRTILDAAKGLFLERGLDDTPMAEIARAAELSKGTLYLYFSSKEELVFALILESLQELKARIRTAADEADSGYERVRAMVDAYRRFYAERSDYVHLYQFLDYQVHFLTEPDSTAYRCFRQSDEIKEIIVEVLHRGQADGSVRSDLDPQKTAELYQHILESFHQKVVARRAFIEQRSSYEPEELLDHMFELILYAIRPHGETEQSRKRDKNENGSNTRKGGGTP